MKAQVVYARLYIYNGFFLTLTKHVEGLRYDDKNVERCAPWGADCETSHMPLA